MAIGSLDNLTSGLQANINCFNNLNFRAIFNFKRNGLELFSKISFYGNICSEPTRLSRSPTLADSSPENNELPISLRPDIESPKTNDHVFPSTGDTRF